MAVIVRQLVPKDAEAYVALRRTMLHDSPPAFLAFPEDEIAADLAAVRERLAAPAETKPISLSRANSIYGIRTENVDANLG